MCAYFFSNFKREKQDDACLFTKAATPLLMHETGYFCQMQYGSESFRIKRPCQREVTVGSHLRKRKNMWATVFNDELMLCIDLSVLISVVSSSIE